MTNMPQLGRHRYEVTFFFNGGDHATRVNVFTDAEVTPAELKQLSTAKAAEFFEYLQMDIPADLQAHSFIKK